VNDLEQQSLFSGMTLDAAGLSVIAAHELGPSGDRAGAFSKTPTGPVGELAATLYTDRAGNALIGYGHLLHEGTVDAADEANYPTAIDQAQATQYLVGDKARAVDAVNKDVKVPLTQDQFDALVDFTYTKGTGALAKSALREAVNKEHFDQVPGQFDEWV
jgi:GH24 family phage-related lysozyme (muramidase)